ncbi:hypothetical protein ACNS7O_08655 [Haloferacaceae archaeon DSL9]
MNAETKTAIVRTFSLGRNLAITYYAVVVAGILFAASSVFHYGIRVEILELPVAPVRLLFGASILLTTLYAAYNGGIIVSGLLAYAIVAGVFVNGIFPHIGTTVDPSVMLQATFTYGAGISIILGTIGHVLGSGLTALAGSRR